MHAQKPFPTLCSFLLVNTDKLRVSENSLVLHRNIFQLALLLEYTASDIETGELFIIYVYVSKQKRSCKSNLDNMDYDCTAICLTKTE